MSAVHAGRAVATLVLMASVYATTVTAQVTAPSSPQLMGSTIPLHWNPSTPAIASSATVDILLAGYGGSPAVLATNVPNNGHATVTLPAPPVLPCEPARLYSIWVKRVGMNTAAFSTQFTIACGATITVVKTVVNSSAGPVPNVTFSVTVACGPNGPNTTLALNGANGFENSVRNVAVGRTCLITEQPPPASVGCRWKTIYPQDRGVDIGAAVEYRREVRNELTCLGVGPFTAATGVGRGAMVADPRVGPGDPVSRLGGITERATINWKGTGTRTITLPNSYSVLGVSGGHTVYQSADGQFFYLDPQTGDVKMLAADFALKPTGGTFIRHDGGRVKIVGVDPAGNVLQSNARGETFYLQPQTGAFVFVKWPK